MNDQTDAPAHEEVSKFQPFNNPSPQKKSQKEKENSPVRSVTKQAKVSITTIHTGKQCDVKSQSRAEPSSNSTSASRVNPEKDRTETSISYVIHQNL